MNLIKRIALVIQYDGAGFCGWQKQKDLRSIQGVLEERIAEIDQTGPIFLICKSGKRSAKAAEILKTKGMNEITNVIGGMDEWKNKIDVG